MERLYKIIIAVLAVWVFILTVQVNNLSNLATNERETSIIENHVDGFSTDLTKISAEVQSSIVTIKKDGEYASGVIYAQDGEDVYVVTNYHAVEDGNIIQVVLDNLNGLQAELIGYDVYTDVAVIKIKCKYNVTPIKLGDSSLLKTGEYVLAFGNPLSLDYRGSVSLGLVSTNARIMDMSVDNQLYFIKMIQSDITLNDGNNGGPLCNQSGEMIGLNTDALNTKDSQGMSFSLPVNEMRLVVDQIIENGAASKVNLGLKVFEINRLMNYQKNNLNINLDVVEGLYVGSVRSDFIGNYIGIKEGDIILRINGEKVDTLDQYIEMEYAVEDKLVVEVLRQGVEMTFEGSINND